jgi:hypothetical protein
VIAHRSSPLRLVVDATRAAEFAPAPGRLRLHGRDDGGRGAELGVFEYKRVAEVRAGPDDEHAGVKLEFLAADGSAWPGDFRFATRPAPLAGPARASRHGLYSARDRARSGADAGSATGPGPSGPDVANRRPALRAAGRPEA